jgi:hypothetical protein
MALLPLLFITRSLQPATKWPLLHAELSVKKAGEGFVKGKRGCEDDSGETNLPREPSPPDVSSFFTASVASLRPDRPRHSGPTQRLASRLAVARFAHAPATPPSPLGSTPSNARTSNPSTNSSNPSDAADPNPRETPPPAGPSLRPDIPETPAGSTTVLTSRPAPSYFFVSSLATLMSSSTECRSL